MPVDVIAIDQIDKILRLVPAERGFREMLILRQVAIRGSVDISEVTTPAARDQDLFSGLIGVIDEQDIFATLTRNGRAHQTGTTSTKDNCIKLIASIGHGLLPSDSGPRRSNLFRAVIPAIEIPRKGYKGDAKKRRNSDELSVLIDRWSIEILHDNVLKITAIHIYQHIIQSAL